jgi:DNA repair protein RadC
MKKTNENIKELHKGHRERMKEKFSSNGNLDCFKDHEVLELLLFYCYPRINTNVIAHKLINKFGTLDVLLETSPKDISNIGDVTMNVAILISLVPHIYRRQLNSKWKERVQIKSSADAGNLAISLLAGLTKETFFVVSLDNQSKLICAEKVNEGTLNEISIYIRDIIEIAIKHKAIKIVLAHNHPSGVLEPSKADIDTTENIINVLTYMDVDVLDHIIVGNDRYYSFSEKRIISVK